MSRPMAVHCGMRKRWRDRCSGRWQPVRAGPLARWSSRRPALVFGDLRVLKGGLQGVDPFASASRWTPSAIPHPRERGAQVPCDYRRSIAG